MKTKKHKLSKNEPIRIWREEEHGHEKDTTDKCGEEPKLFQWYMNKTSKHREDTVHLKDEDGVHEDWREMSELFNMTFQNVLRKELNFEPPQRVTGKTGIQETEVRKWDDITHVRDMKQGKKLGRMVCWDTSQRNEDNNWMDQSMAQ